MRAKYIGFEIEIYYKKLDISWFIILPNAVVTMFS